LSEPDVLQGVIEQARSGPRLPAVKDLDRELSYEALLAEVALVGAGLTSRGVVGGDRVALLLANSVDFVVAALASLWIGAIFVPLAVTDPQPRLASIVEDCDAAIIVTSTAREGDPVARSTFDGRLCVSVDELRDETVNGSAPVDASPRVAYAIYTSGTTGAPKGVLIGNRAFGAAVNATSKALGLDRSTRTLCVSPFYFDGSFATLFATLFTGGAVVLRPRDALLFARTFFNAVSSEHITYTGFSPSYLRLLLASPQITSLGDSSLEVIALGGEAGSLSDIRLLWSYAPRLRLFNRYGPTETTIAVTHVQLTPENTSSGSVPIGRPHEGVTFHLLDEHGREIEGNNQTGELYIGGAQLMDGYWGAPELTREVLRTDVGAEGPVYRTGDLVFRRDDGNYVFVDRADRVIKRSGVRISLIELGAQLGNVEGVSAAVCLTFDDGGSLGIVAFVVADRPLSALDLERAARELLPATMIPNRFELVEELPLTKSNKLDEQVLLDAAGLKPLPPATSARS